MARVPSRAALKRWFKRAYGLINETVTQYSNDGGEMIAAALAFYTLLSIAPLIIIAVAIAGSVLGRAAAEREATRVLSDAMGPDAAATVQGWARQASDSGGIASIVGFVLVLFTASRLGAQLRVALNKVWNVDIVQAEGFKGTVRDYVKRSLFASCSWRRPDLCCSPSSLSRAPHWLSDVLFVSAPGSAA